MPHKPIVENDQGTTSDATSGNQVFTIEQTFDEAIAIAILMQVSWGARGGLGRAISNRLCIEVQ